MKIAQVDEAVERGNTGMEKTFKIQANSRAFQILSSNLYANKIKAVIRELSCNALDSHVAVGRTDVPFDVHLPNSMEPYFSVQDYGLGLSHDQVMNIYTTYFDSNKTGTNDLIGGLGLGSKSPFSYTSSFDVISTHDGVARSYAMFFNEAGHPSVAYMGETATSAPNGVRINMPVKASDFDAFRENAQEVFQWFSHPPVVSGNSRYSLPNVEVNKTLGGLNWQLMDTQNSRYHRYNARPLAIMGNVAYPLKADSLDHKYRQLLQWPLLIKFGIGELDVSASREDLSYDPVTVSVIELRLAAILADLRKVVEQKFVECKSLWEARILMRQISSDYVMSDIMRTLSQAGFSPKFQEGDVGDYAYISWNSVLDKNSKNHPRLMNVSATSRGKVIGHVDADAKTVFVLKDVHNAAQRCREAYYMKSSNQRVILIEGGEGWNALECAVVPLILAHLGNPNTILASSLAAPPKRVMQFKGTPWTGNASSWRPRKMDNWGKEVSLTTAQGGYYVTMEGSTPVKPSVVDATGKVTDYADIKLDVIIKNAIALGIIPAGTTIMGLNKTNTKLVKGVKNWVEFSEFVRLKLATYMSTNNVVDLVKSKNQLETINHKFYDNAPAWYTKFGKHDGVMGKFVNEWLRVTKTMDKKLDVTALRQLCVSCGVTWNYMDSTSPNDLADLYDQVQTKYPLIQKFLRDWINSDEFKMFTDYVNLIDTVTK